MTFVYPLLLGGLLLAGVPVLLHFLIRKKPQTLVFPAFRFLIQKRRSNTRNLRLKHLLLLLLRMALIVLVCLALARPRVLQESLGLSREKPVALVLIFDTSPSMEYKSGEQTRLDLAKKRCLELLDQLPEDGRVLILDTSDPAAFAREDWLKSMDKARQRVQGLTIQPNSVSVTKAIEEAFRHFDKLDDAAEGMPRMACMFSDRTRASWDFSAGAKRKPDVNVLYFDVGIDDPADLAITNLGFPGNRQSFADGAKISLRVAVKATGKPISPTSTLVFQIGKVSIEQIVPVEPDKEQSLLIEIDTAARAVGPGLHHAEVKLVPDKDALAFNNARFVTFEIQEKQKVLVLSDDGKYSANLVLALQSNLYAVEVKSTEDPLDFTAYPAVFVHGVAAPTDKLWTALERHVQQGGGVCIIPPGDALQANTYHSPSARTVMPGILGEKASSPLGSIWSVGFNELDHPFLRRHQDWFDGVVDISKSPRSAKYYWEVKADKSNIVLSYDTGAPAVVERHWKSGGKALLLTTPLEMGETWNNYGSTSSLHAFFVGLTRLCAEFLYKEQTQATFNHQFGYEPPVLARTQPFAKYLLTAGDASEEIRFDEKDRWVGDRLPRAGNYLLRGSNPGQTTVLHKFSINVPAAESDLTRVPAGDIEAVLGNDAIVSLDRNTPILDALTWDEPVELFPWLMIATLFLLAFESLLANRFYRPMSEPEAGVST